MAGDLSGRVYPQWGTVIEATKDAVGRLVEAKGRGFVTIRDLRAVQQMADVIELRAIHLTNCARNAARNAGQPNFGLKVIPTGGDEDTPKKD
ncbi:Hypothetical predicted protein [Lecanosticta acicola]|uniref:Uncharacterized protein n=1 Tax=Lecanosticta acicola TaxID=111012 RepID=A0AAI8YWW7_9PEZI|nr:Hypothetical predicted protein [Lecanosticta acicola]